MSKRRIDLIVVVVLAALIVLTYLVVTSAADAAYEGVSVRHARAHVQQAARDVRRANAALSEARRVLSATRRYSSQYGPAVGRWAWLAADVSWAPSEWPTLFMVIDRESGGMPGVDNGAGSGAAGLLQLMPGWYSGQWGYPAGDPHDPRYNLKAGVWMWHREGWQPWAVN